MLSFIENLYTLTCPITHETFIEPVIGSDCHTYERNAIVEWLHKHGTSPMTGETMSINSLRSNLAMKNIIEELSQILNAHTKSDKIDQTQICINTLYSPKITRIISNQNEQLVPPPIPRRQPIKPPTNNKQLHNTKTDEKDIITTWF